MHGGKARPKSAKFVSYSLVLPHELNGHTIWCTCGVTLWLPTGALNGYARNMALSERQLLDDLSWTPFVDSTELALILWSAEPARTPALAGCNS